MSLCAQIWILVAVLLFSFALSASIFSFFFLYIHPSVHFRRLETPKNRFTVSACGNVVRWKVWKTETEPAPGHSLSQIHNSSRLSLTSRDPTPFLFSSFS